MRRWLIALFALLYLALGHGHFKSSDEIAVFETTASLWERGDLVAKPGPHVYRAVDGRLYSHFALGQSLLALPLYGLGKLAGAVLPDALGRALAGPRRPPDGRAGGSVEIAVVSFYGALVGALLVGLFHAFERELGASPRAAVAAAVVFGAGSYTVMQSAFFLRHGSEALAILAALYGLRRYRVTGSLPTLALAAAAGSAIPLIRLPSAVAGPALAAYLAWALVARSRSGDSPRRTGAALAVASLPLLAALALHGLANHARWGSWLASPMLAQAGFFTTSLGTGLRGLLLSPGASLFVYSPPLLLLPWILPPFFRSQRAECVAAVAVVLSFLLVAASFWSWSGLWASPGPRYVFVAAPLLLLPLGPWLDAGRGRGRWLAAFGLAGLGALVELGVTLARWQTVINTMNYQRWDPGMEFLFMPSQSPVLAAWRVVAAGGVDAWLWWLARGWPGEPGRPLLALALLGLLALGSAVCVRGLVRAVPRAA